MVTYAAARDADSKKLVWILQLPSSQRYVNSRIYSLLSSSASTGLRVLSDLETAIDLRTGDISFGEIEVLLENEDGGVGTYLANNDSTLNGSNALLKYGFVDVAEASFKTLNLLVCDWRRIPDGFVLTLKPAMSILRQPILEDFENDNFSLSLDYPMTINGARLQGDLDAAGWRSTGEVLFVNQNTGVVELFSYTEIRVVSATNTRITGTSAGPLTRKVHDIGFTGQEWPKEDTQVMRAWAFNENPIDLFLRLATTTAGGGNGPDDAGDGDGLGIDSTLIDRATFISVRDTRMLDEAGAVRKGLYLGGEPIKSVYEFFRDEFLALGLRLGVTADAKITVRRHPNLTTTTEDIDGKFITSGIPVFERNWQEVENNLSLGYGWNPKDNTCYTNLDRQHATSQTRYGKSALRELKARGCYGLVARGFGWPDLGWDRYLAKQASMYLIEFANPSQDIPLQGTIKLQDLVPGDLKILSHNGIFDLDAGSMGITKGLFYLTGFQREPEDGQVALKVRQRRGVGRIAYWAPNGHPTYAAATAAEKQFGFWSPNAGNFPDGGAPYEWGTS